MLSKFDWDDLRIIAAVAEQGSYARAGASLRLDETTVGRRLARVQDRLGVTLFEAVDGVRKATARCEVILAHVREIERRVAEIGNVGNPSPGVVGMFRIASTPAVLDDILAPTVPQLLNENPGLTLRFMGADPNVNFSRWETDLAVRLRKPAKGDFAISKLGESQLYLFEPALPAAAGQEPFICQYPEERDSTEESKALMARGLYGRARCVTDSLSAMRAMIRAHSAIAIMPRHVCRDLLGDPSLRITPLEERVEFWLLVQNHLKRDRAARLVIDWVRSTFASLA